MRVGVVAARVERTELHFRLGDGHGSVVVPTDIRRLGGADPSWPDEARPWMTSRGSGPVLDLACGSAPLRRLIPDLLCIGMDSSRAELGVASSAGATPLILASSSDIPLSDKAVAAVVCSMALRVLQPIDRTLDEVARVLRPGGMLVVIVPAGSPLSFRDRVRYARLIIALRVARLGYPNDDALTSPVSLLQSHGLNVLSDERRRFRLDLSGQEECESFVQSFYLPGRSSTRACAAVRVARRWQGSHIGIPLRRIVAIRSGSNIPSARSIPRSAESNAN